MQHNISITDQSQNASNLPWPHSGILRRMRTYTSEMYPFIPRIISATLLFSGFTSMLSVIHGTPFSFFSLITVVGTASVFLLLFILRLMDELKDKEIDRRLFRLRPLPSGKVFESDIRFSIMLSVIIYSTLHVLHGVALFTAMVVLVYAFAMFRFFFIPRILKRSLLLTLATHNPIVPLLLGHLTSLHLFEHHLFADIDVPSVALLILQFWAMSFSWEIARKIRSKDDENEYVTYSRLLGQTGAVFLAATAQTLTLAIGAYFYVSLELTGAYLGIIIIGYLAMMFTYTRFLKYPSRETSQLRPKAEVYIISVLTASILASAL